MCGIFGLLNNSSFSKSFIKEQFYKGKPRGPEGSVIQAFQSHTIFGFHRLAINGLTSESDQPITIQHISLICNGEIYNYKELCEITGIYSQTASDCEIIIHLYLKYGMEHTLHLLDGVFAFALLDKNTSQLYLARDPYGVRPLYILHPTHTHDPVYAFASELKSLSDMHSDATTISQFPPGTYSQFILDEFTWLPPTNTVYHTTAFSLTYSPSRSLQPIFENIILCLKDAVEKRCSTTERPIACLLSGGLDSSLITALVNEYYKEYQPSLQLETYSIGLAGSPDLMHAKIVADYLGTKHTEIVLTESDFVNAIPEVIRAIESYDSTTVRASIGNYLIGKYISTHSDAKVIFNGDGADELTGGYLYMKSCPDAVEFDKETRRLLRDIHAFDVLRSDKCISSHGLEPRTPFLDRAWVQYYLSLPLSVRFCPNECEKWLLRSAFAQYKNHNGASLIPHEIVWRQKEAFSDGVSCETRSLYTIIQEHCMTMGVSEPQYYRQIFDDRYPGLADIVPYYWMPRYINATDPSARTYKNRVYCT